MTLVELTISLAIVSVIAAGGYAMLVRTQKYAAQKRIALGTQNEIDQLLGIIKKDWDYRTKGDDIVFPESGHSRLNAASTPCGLNVPCPKLKLWLKRTIDGVNIINEVLIENFCQRPSSTAVRKQISLLNPVAKLDTACHTCPAGDIPAVSIKGVNMATKQVALAAENRIFPQNAADKDKVNTDIVVGMQACFTQAQNKGPISVDVRAMHRDQSGTQLKLVQKTQVYPFENFASIRLEQ